MKLICKLSTQFLGIRGTEMKWVFCPYLKGRKKVAKVNIENCKKCRFFICIKNSGLYKKNTYVINSRIKQQRGYHIGIAGHIKKLSSISKSAIGIEKRKRTGNKKIYTTIELKGELEPLVDVFDERDKVRVLVKIPFHYQQEEITLECGKKNGSGELIILAKDYEQRIPIKKELAVELTGNVQLRSLKSGIINAELNKGSKKM